MLGVAVGFGGLPLSLQRFALGTVRLHPRAFEAAGIKRGDLRPDELREAVRDAVSNVTDFEDEVEAD